MSLAAGPVFAVAVLTVVAGAAKVVEPSNARRSLAAIGVRVPPRTVQALGLVECLVGTSSLAWGSRLTSAVLLVSWAGFALTAWRLARRGSTPCGCFGRTDATVGTAHVAVDVVGCTIAAAAVVWPPGGIGDVLASQPLGGLPFVVSSGSCAYLLYLMLTSVPRLANAAGDETTARAGR